MQHDVTVSGESRPESAKCIDAAAALGGIEETHGLFRSSLGSGQGNSADVFRAPALGVQDASVANASILPVSGSGRLPGNEKLRAERDSSGDDYFVTVSFVN
jgi:hypothetical protein